MRVFVSVLLNENDVKIFETIETRHFNTSNYIRFTVLQGGESSQIDPLPEKTIAVMKT